MKTILVTGGAGFIGSHLCKRLIDDGHYVYCLDNLYSGLVSNIEELVNHPRFTFIAHNVVKSLQLKNEENLIIDEVDEIYHLACPASPKAYQKNPIFTLDTNYIGSKNMLELARKNKAKILLTSTSEVYGNPKLHPQVENYFGNVNPIGIRACYDEGKRISETLFFDYYRKYEIPIRVARIFNTYGPNMKNDDGRVITNFINQALHNNDITLYGDGQQTRSFCYVSDMVEGLIKLMDSDVVGPVNLGNPEEHTIFYVASYIKRLMNSNSKIVSKKLPEDDPVMRKPDITLAMQLLDWFPTVKFEDGLRETISHIKVKNDTQRERTN